MQQDPNDELLKLRFYATPPHTCSYLTEQQATTVFLDPEKQISSKLYTRLSESGFRRSGSHVYKPYCQQCEACVPVRIPAAKFRPNRNQRRCLKRGSFLEVKIQPAIFNQEQYELYERYIHERHSDGDMYPPSESQFKDFLLCDWSQTEFICFYDKGELIATAVVDWLNSGLSAVYTYYNPDYSYLSPGRLAILTMIEIAKTRELDYVYLGFLVRNCQKMKYKSEYRPLDCFVGNHWIQLN
ncbi:arginyltransferase [Pleionea sp. CnH1-48]|uniref:arginyltransferase n=1 Tax=Pleionea sp. CnH1-48 TaxID=2954494 RepID=UPI002097443F|nr:arginyltransferase [Pleionea sp. CnH1-48]